MPWDYAPAEYEKQAARDPRFRLERLITYGLKEGERIPRVLLERHFRELRIPDNRRAFLELLLWGKLS